jgi:hypothetical protein
MPTKSYIGDRGTSHRTGPVRRPAATQARQPGRPTNRPLARKPGDRRPARTDRNDHRRTFVIAGLAALGAGILLIAYLVFWAPGPSSACVVAVDAQGSTQEMVSTYRDWLPQEITNCAKAHHAQVTTMLINGDTSTGRTMPVTTNLRKVSGLTGNKADDDPILDQAISSFAQRAADMLFQAPPSQYGTDLISTGCVARPFLKNHAHATLVIDSDGINNRSPYNFGFIPLSDQHISAIIAHLQETNQLCDLSHVIVEWYGVGVGNGTSHFTPGTLDEVQRFWFAYFTACHATLAVYQRSL